MDTLKLMEELTQVIGIAGDERYVSKLLKSYLQPYCDELIYDHLGSLFAVKKSQKKMQKRSWYVAIWMKWV